MSTPARVMPLRSPLASPEPKRANPLRLVPPRRSSAAKTPFVVVLVGLLVGGLLGLLLLNTLVAQQSFAIHDLAVKDKALAQQEQDLARQVQGLQTPSSLAARAAALKMVPSGPPAFLRLTDGKVLGTPSAGVAPVVVAPATASTTWTGPKPGTTKPTGTTAATATTPTRATPTRPTKPATTTGAHR